MRLIKTFENYDSTDTLIIVDVQRSFRRFFSEMYLNELKKYCRNFKDVYLLWDNHHQGKNVDKDYLYCDNPKTPISDEFYNFPNLKMRIEKRYNYDVDADFYKKILNNEVYQEISNKEDRNQLKVGDMFPTKKGTYIVYIGNNHKWHHLSKKLYDLLSSLKDKNVTIVGGSDSECLQDIFIASQSLGVNIKRDWKYIYTANSCPI